MKTCAKCRDEKPRNEFNIAVGSKDGLSSYCKECNKIYCKNYKKEQKLKIIKEYGNKCVCCGETRWEFLGLDHIAGGGIQHRKKIGTDGGTAFYIWVIKNNYPKDILQLLCQNCNMSKGMYGYCPHKLSG